MHLEHRDSTKKKKKAPLKIHKRHTLESRNLLAHAEQKDLIESEEQLPQTYQRETPGIPNEFLHSAHNYLESESEL